MSTKEEQTKQAADLVEEGKKAIALKEWELAVEKYADALELMRTLHGEMDPLLSPLLLSYGKSLFEVAVSQQGVLGREEVEKERLTKKLMESVQGGPSSSAEEPSDPRFQIDQPNLAGEEEQEEEGAEGEGAEEGEDEEPEDEFGEAWEILDLARNIYEERIKSEVEGVEEIKKQLGDCYILLGDISLETENFPQATEDYKSALSTLTPVVPFTSPTIAEAHFKLAMAYESVKDGGREQALKNVEKAIESVEGRKELAVKGETEADGEKEIKLMEENLKEMQAKLEDLKTAPPPAESTKDQISQILGVGHSDLSSTLNGNGNGTNGSASAAVNNISGLVKKKAKTVVPSTTAKDLETVASDLLAKAQGIASNGIDAISQAASKVVEQVMEEGQELTKETVAAVSETAVDAMEGIESAAAAGKKAAGEFGSEAAEVAASAGETLKTSVSEGAETLKRKADELEGPKEDDSSKKSKVAEE